jgi:transitional endoplasmic reticulum ATPase
MSGGYNLTDGGKLTIKLKVAEADQRDVGKGIVRMDESFRQKLGLKPFDVVEVKVGNQLQPLWVALIPVMPGLILSEWTGLSVRMQKRV